MDTPAALLALLLAALCAAAATAGPVETATEPSEHEPVTLEKFVEQVKTQLRLLQKKRVISHDGSDAEVGKLISLLEKLSADEQLTRGVECDDQKCAEHCKTRPGFNTGYCNHYRLCSCYYSPNVTPAPPTDCPR
ncbi:Tenecin-1 [Frankliniella fusca]|uniref:Tenecin-1 n=1 Tax=Frankliniella fusca TaxID=407009 RepID=A0AAE1L7E7_9NEOP|nr:Tenecin-1 [Frankliniella fusca]